MYYIDVRNDRAGDRWWEGSHYPAGDPCLGLGYQGGKGRGGPAGAVVDTIQAGDIHAGDHG